MWRPEKCKAKRFSVFYPSLFGITWVVLAFSYYHQNLLYLPLFQLGAKSWRALIRDVVRWYFPRAQEQLLFDLPCRILLSAPYLSFSFFYLLTFNGTADPWSLNFEMTVFITPFKWTLWPGASWGSTDRILDSFVSFDQCNLISEKHCQIE